MRPPPLFFAASLLFAVAARAAIPPDLLAAQAAAEKALPQVESIVKAKILSGGGDSLKLKLYYADGAQAIFKPNHVKWNAKGKHWHDWVAQPFRPELAV